MRIDIPLIGQHWLNDNIRAVAKGLRDHLVLNLNQQPKRINIGDHGLSRVEPIHADIFFRHDVASFHRACLVHQFIHGQIVALGDVMIVEIMRAGNLHRAGAKIRIGIVIGNDRDQAVCQRQMHHLAYDRRIARIVRVHRHRAIAQHGFRPGGGDRDIVALFFKHDITILILFDIGISLAIGEHIFEMPEMALHFAVLNLKIRNGRLEVRIPIDHALIAVNQALIIELHEDFAHRSDHLVIFCARLAHSEFLTRPVAGCAQPFELVDDLPAGLFFPLPNALNESFAAKRGAAFIPAIGRHLAFDHHLRRNPRMIGARLPQHILAAHSLKPDQYILKRVVEGMAHMQHARDIWRRDDNRIGLRAGIAGRLETARLFPRFIDALFGLGRIESLIEHIAWLLIRWTYEKGAPSKDAPSPISVSSLDASVPCGQCAELRLRPSLRQCREDWRREGRSELLKAWPICSTPVTFGGGMTIE